MTREEAETVAVIALEADGDCPHCSMGLINMLINAFPEHEALFEKLYDEKYVSGTEPDYSEVAS